MVKKCEKCGRPNLLGYELTKLNLECVYLSADGKTAYIDVSRSWKGTAGKEAGSYHLGYISFPIKHVLEWLLTAGETETWQDNLKRIREHQRIIRENR